MPSGICNVCQTLLLLDIIQDRRSFTKFREIEPESIYSRVISAIFKFLQCGNLKKSTSIHNLHDKTLLRISVVINRTPD